MGRPPGDPGGLRPSAVAASKGPWLPSRKTGEMKRRAERNAGAFLTPDLGGGGGMIPVPMRTLSDDYSDEPEPEDSDRVPTPEQPRLVHRLLTKLARQSDRRRPSKPGSTEADHLTA